MTTESETRKWKGLPPRDAVIVSLGLVVGFVLGQIAVGAPATIPDYLTVLALAISTPAVVYMTIVRRKVDLELGGVLLGYLAVLVMAFSGIVA